MSLLEKKTHVGRAVCGSTNKKLLYFNMDKGKKKKKHNQQWKLWIIKKRILFQKAGKSLKPNITLLKKEKLGVTP